MRYRATLLLLMSGLFAIAPFLQWHQQQAICIQEHGASADDRFMGLFGGISGSPTVCPVFSAPSPWIHALGVLSVLCLAGWLFFLLQCIAERRHEQALLRGAGIEVPEDQLPLED